MAGASSRRPSSLQPIPPHATVAFTGELFEVVSWRQHVFDGSERTFEKVRRPDTALVIPVVNGLLQITRQEQPGCTEPFYELIGGRLEPGESPEDGAQRELREESGLVAGSLELWAALQPFTKIDWAVFIFIARDCVESPGWSSDAGERIEVLSVSLEELVRLARTNAFRDLVAALHILRDATDPVRLGALQALLGL